MAQITSKLGSTVNPGNDWSFEKRGPPGYDALQQI